MLGGGATGGNILGGIGDGGSVGGGGSAQIGTVLGGVGGVTVGGGGPQTCALDDATLASIDSLDLTKVRLDTVCKKTKKGQHTRSDTTFAPIGARQFCSNLAFRSTDISPATGVNMSLEFFACMCDSVPVSMSVFVSVFVSVMCMCVSHKLMHVPTNMSTNTHKFRMHVHRSRFPMNCSIR